MNTQQLEARSDAERAEVEDTIGQIRKRLSPGQLVDELLAYTNDGGGAFITNLGRQATNNPLPVSLIGAGLAWFLFSKGGSQPPFGGSASRGRTASPSAGGFDSGSSSDSNHAFADAAGGAAAAMSNAVSTGTGAVREGMAAASDRLSHGADVVTGAVSSASRSVKDSLARGASAVGETAGAARRSASELASNATGFLQEQPLVLLGAGLALGAAIGASLPTTQAENEMLGETSADLKSQAKDIASDHLDKAQAAGEHLYGKVKDDLAEEVAHLSRGDRPDGAANDSSASESETSGGA